MLYSFKLASKNERKNVEVQNIYKQDQLRQVKYVKGMK
jgi:hypothetical protein